MGFLAWMCGNYAKARFSMQRFQSGLQQTLRQQRRICSVQPILLYHFTILASQ
jgi:hypothetical protein